MSHRRALPLMQGLLRAACSQLSIGAAYQLAPAALAAAASQPMRRAPLTSLLQLRGFAEPAAAPSVVPEAATAGSSSSSGGATPSAITLEPRELLPTSRRTGVIAIKAGMTQEWDAWGVRQPLTILWIDDCQVVQVKTPEREGYAALQLGAGSKRAKQLNGRQRGHCNAAGVPLKRTLAEFRVSGDCLLPVGTPLGASHFVPGQFVDVAGTTIGKGFQGVMKRWGFAGGNASHGNTKKHRSAGGIGACQDPGKVWPGKKMAGRMGGGRRTAQNCWVYKVDASRNLVYVRGAVPGNKGGVLFVRDAVKKGPPLQGVAVARPPAADPYDYAE